MAVIRYGLAFLRGARHPSTVVGTLHGAFIVAQKHDSEMAKIIVLLDGKHHTAEMDAKAAKEKLRYFIEDRNWLWMCDKDLDVYKHSC
jgi:hypothetical protein